MQDRIGLIICLTIAIALLIVYTMYGAPSVGFMTIGMAFLTIVVACTEQLIINANKEKAAYDEFNSRLREVTIYQQITAEEVMRRQGFSSFHNN